MNSLSGNVFQQPQIPYIPTGHSRKWIQVGCSLHCLTNITQRGKTALRCIWIHRRLHISTSYCKTLMLSKDKMWTPEQGKGCVCEWTTQCWRRRGSGTQMGLYLWDVSCQLAPLWPHALCSHPISSGSTGGDHSWCTPPHLSLVESHSCAVPQSTPHNESKHGKWVPWKSISCTVIGSPEVYHSIRRGLLIKVADRNITWKNVTLFL